jgi:hypothetical protein
MSLVNKSGGLYFSPKRVNTSPLRRPTFKTNDKGDIINQVAAAKRRDKDGGSETESAASTTSETSTPMSETENSKKDTKPKVPVIKAPLLAGQTASPAVSARKAKEERQRERVKKPLTPMQGSKAAHDYAQGVLNGRSKAASPKATSPTSRSPKAISPPASPPSVPLSASPKYTRTATDQFLSSRTPIWQNDEYQTSFSSSISHELLQKAIVPEHEHDFLSLPGVFFICAS